MTLFLEFDLRIETTSDGIKTSVLDSPYGQAVSEWRGRIESTYLNSESSIQQHGSLLFNALFRDEVLALWRRSVDDVNEQNKNLRLKIRFAPNTTLDLLPWESLFDPVMGEFLSLHGRISIIRFLEVPQPSRPIIISYPLRILAVIANPSDFPQLDVETEWKTLSNALQSVRNQGLVDIDRLNPPTATNLQHKLRQEEYHIIHFVGHGTLDEERGSGYILLIDENGQGRPIYSQHWSILLGAERRSLGLIILNACQTSNTTIQNPYGGIAQSLVRLGIPAVIANQKPITDSAALAFSKEFYSALVEGKMIDNALCEGRKAIYNAGYPLEWVVPNLFLRSTSEGQIFQLQKVDVDKIVRTLENSMAPDDPTPQQLLRMLNQFQEYHELLHEWKEVHNYINDVLFQLGQFSREVERLDASGDKVNPGLLRRLWRPVSQKVSLLLEWAKSDRKIFENPFNGVKGPKWAIFLHDVTKNIESILQTEPLTFSNLYDATFEFVDVAEREMYLADKSLRNTAEKLYNLSRIVLGRTVS